MDTNQVQGFLAGPPKDGFGDEINGRSRTKSWEALLLPTSMSLQDMEQTRRQPNPELVEVLSVDEAYEDRPTKGHPLSDIIPRPPLSRRMSAEKFDKVVYDKLLSATDYPALPGPNDPPEGLCFGTVQRPRSLSHPWIRKPSMVEPPLEEDPYEDLSKYGSMPVLIRTPTSTCCLHDRISPAQMLLRGASAPTAKADRQMVRGVFFIAKPEGLVGSPDSVAATSGSLEQVRNCLRL
jgi:hypothetical protein